MCQVGLFILRYKLQILISQDFEDWSHEFQNIIEGEIVCFINQATCILIINFLQIVKLKAVTLKCGQYNFQFIL